MECSPLSLRILQGSSAIYVVVFLACLSADVQAKPDPKLKWQRDSSCKEMYVKRSNFPREFAFGVATAAAQIEGSAKEGGKGPSVWDEFVEKFPGKINGSADMFTAIDSYNRYKEDAKLLKNLGVNFYRFSIPWTRILPDGSLSGGVDQEGIDHYSNLIDELISNGITPFVTLFHFDSPQALQDKYGGFLNHMIVKDFKDYCEICFKSFGDRVKNWITINEPNVIAVYGYEFGVAPPGRCSISGPAGGCPAGNSSTEPYIVSHNLLLAHATAVRLYKDKFKATQGGQIGISLVGQYFEPYSSSPEDKAAMRRALDFNMGWYIEPLVHGHYPRSMRYLVKDRLPTFTEEEKKLVKGSYDFIGINYYTTRYAKHLRVDPHAPPHYSTDSLTNLTTDKDGVPIGPNPGTFIYIYPKGLQKLLLFMKRSYKSPKIYITENGIPERSNDSLGLQKALKDPHRIRNTVQHMHAIHAAMKQGVKVEGYFYWTLFDDFEFQDGYSLRFGLYYIDYKDNFRRIPKQSAKWLRRFLEGKYIRPKRCRLINP
ncbi:Beta-glucosidase 24 [Morella rubra]|uniref:Beta-glucosidase 24 n=1 Tax=Morella rubra TaxID=262757 RepID=A0A6A1VWG9_9ROSI|nr:Beta-glucosidase 24 [Morella rubra]